MQGCPGSMAVKGMRQHQGSEQRWTTITLTSESLLNTPVLKLSLLNKTGLSLFGFKLLWRNNSPTICQLMAVLTEPVVVKHKVKLVYVWQYSNLTCSTYLTSLGWGSCIVLTLGLHRDKENYSVLLADHKIRAPSCSIQVLLVRCVVRIKATE